MDEHGVIEVRDVHRRYQGRGSRGFEAVRGVNFTVRRGELFALLGTNGAGKTSTLELLEGIARPTTGTVRVFGRDPYRDRGMVRPRVGIMLQEGGFPADLTVAETARMWAGTLIRPLPIGQALELVGLDHRARVAVKQLSGGERRRLDLAMAILGRPEVLFLDEPTAGLDPESRRRSWALIRDLLAAGSTVVLTTHYLEEVEELADRLAILHHGRIVRGGTPAEVAGSVPARISFTQPPVGTEPLPALPGGVVQEPGHANMVLRTGDLQQTLTALLDWAGRHHIRLLDLVARPASLEQAFLAVAESGDQPAATVASGTAGEVAA
jgi:ABC-2 type transport system ATP-binding protein